MKGWREKRREARWKRKARMRNLEKINKNKKCLAAKIIWICSRFPWRRELKCRSMCAASIWTPVAFREGVSWNLFGGLAALAPLLSPSVKAWVEITKFLKLYPIPFASPSVKAWVEIGRFRLFEHYCPSPSVKAWVEICQKNAWRSISQRRLPWSGRWNLLLKFSVKEFSF